MTQHTDWFRVGFFKFHEEARVPTYATDASSGADLCAFVNPTEPIVICPGDRELIKTGIGIKLPMGFEAQVRPRSGLALRHGLSVLNSPGTIDSDYRGQIEVLLYNGGHEKVTIRNGDRIAQLVIAPVIRALFVEAAPDRTDRGSGGFGSTGI